MNASTIAVGFRKVAGGANPTSCFTGEEPFPYFNSILELHLQLSGRDWAPFLEFVDSELAERGRMHSGLAAR